MLIERGKQSLRLLHSTGWEEWEVIEAILDCGASVTFIPLHMVGGYAIQECSITSRCPVRSCEL